MSRLINGLLNSSNAGFPLKRPTILQKWIAACNRKNWNPTPHSTLCSNHFNKEDYQIRPGCSVEYLTENAVPSNFNFPNHFGPKSKKQPLTLNKRNKKSEKQQQQTLNENNEISSNEPKGGKEKEQQTLNKNNNSSSTATRTLPAIILVAALPTGTKQCVDKSVQCSIDTTKVPRLRRTVKILRQRLQRRTLTMKRLKNDIRETKKTLHESSKGQNNRAKVGGDCEHYFGLSKMCKIIAACCLCSNKQLKSTITNISMHKFPTDSNLMSRWKEVCNLTERNVVTSLKVCRKHFKDSDYTDANVARGMRLKRHAVPSINVPNPMQNVATNCGSSTLVTNASAQKENSDNLNEVPQVAYSTSLTEISEDPILLNGVQEEVEIAMELTISSDENNSPSACQNRNTESMSQENNTASTISIVRRRKRVPVTQNAELSQRKIKNQKKKITSLQQTNRRFRLQIHSLKTLLSDSQQKRLLSGETGYFLEVQE